MKELSKACSQPMSVEVRKRRIELASEGTRAGRGIDVGLVRCYQYKHCSKALLREEIGRKSGCRVDGR